MSTMPNHVVQSRAQLAEASELADAGSTALARVHLRFAADHALFALAEIGTASDDVAPVLRDLDDDGIDCMHDPLLAARLAAGFGLVQELIDAYIAHPASRSRHEAPARMPLYGGASGALNARGAEAAARGLGRIAAAVRAALRR